MFNLRYELILSNVKILPFRSNALAKFPNSSFSSFHQFFFFSTSTKKKCISHHEFLLFSLISLVCSLRCFKHIVSRYLCIMKPQPQRKRSYVSLGEQILIDLLSLQNKLGRSTTLPKKIILFFIF